MVKRNISEAQKGISFALGSSQEYFRAGSSPRVTEAKGESQEMRIGTKDKFHPCKKIISKASHKY